MYKELAELLANVQRLVKNDGNDFSKPMDVEQAAFIGSRIEDSYDKFLHVLRVQAITVPEFWDCDCKENYIHSSGTTCNSCGCHIVDDTPDSRLIEVLEMFANTALKS